MAGGNTANIEIEKSLISLGIFPVNFRILNSIDINVGVEISRLIHEKFNGTESGWAMYFPNWENTLQDEYERYSSLNYAGFIGRVAYDFNLTETIAISPQYSFYYSILNEFDEFPVDTRSMRHMFCIGIEKKLK